MQDPTRPRFLAHTITYSSRERRVELFRELPLSVRSAVFVFLSPRLQKQLLDHLSVAEVVDILDHLDLRLANVIVARMAVGRRRTAIVENLKTGLKEKIEQFIAFHPKATNSLVSFNYILLSDDATIAAAADALAEYRRDTGRFPEILIHHAGEFVGSVSLNMLIRERNQTRLKQVVEPVPTISYDENPRKILDFFVKAPHTNAVVLDTDGSVIGVIYADDIIAFFEEQGSESLYDFAGVAESERPFDTVRQKVGRRWKWLLLNLGTAFLAAGAVTFFEDTIAQVVILAAYLPIIAGMGGNAATQTLAVMVRGITIGEITLRECRRALINEVTAGAINGLITGAIVALIAGMWNANPLLGIVVGISMVINLIIAGFFGTLIPLILKRFGRDPATSAVIFITTATDVLGFAVFLGLATLLLI